MKRILMLASLLAAGMPLGAQNLGSEYRLKRVIPVEGRQGVRFEFLLCVGQHGAL